MRDKWAGQHAGEVAIIFTALRNDDDPEGYAAASAAMKALAEAQPGFRGFVSARGEDGQGITVSYWADEAAAVAWRDNPVHAGIRQAGRDRWYDRYEVTVADVVRDYRWRRPE